MILYIIIGLRRSVLVIEPIMYVCARCCFLHFGYKLSHREGIAGYWCGFYLKLLKPHLEQSLAEVYFPGKGDGVSVIEPTRYHLLCRTIPTLLSFDHLNIKF